MPADHGRLLRPFDPRHAGVVASWVLNAQEATWWAGAGFPVSGSVVLGWQSDPGAHGFLLLDGDKMVAYGEIWDDAEESESEFAHLIVDPAVRGRGLGRALVRSLIPRAGFDALLMRVHPANMVARNCYLTAGFTLVDAERAAAWNEPQPVPYVWLEGTRS